VVHRDEQLLVVVKPSGLPTTSPDSRDCLVQRALAIDPRAPRLHPSSRLDAEVSGLVTFARTRRATQALLAARRRGTYGRVYLGIAAQAPEPAAGQWDAAIGIDPDDKRLRKTGGLSSREARTVYEVRERAPEGACVLELRPHTGRTHQLRVHAAHAGAPLLGDVFYGGPRRVVRPDGRVVTARRVMLHCHALTLPDVARGSGTLKLVEPMPEDMHRVWDELGGALP
jgi:23S rRNA-/tRNA-specific pseudouridylate synthase